VGSNPFDHARAQIFFDSFHSARRNDGHRGSLELSPVRTVLHPPPLAVEVFPWEYLRHRADDRHELPLPRHVDSKHTESILRALKSDPLDDSGQPFTRGLS